MPEIVWYNRTEECKQCGDCCSNSPWPRTWPEWLVAENREDLFPHGELFFGFEPETSGVAEVEGKKYPWAWIKGHGVVKGPDSFECPFLTKDGDKRPCALVGTEYEYAYDVACREGPEHSGNGIVIGIPPRRASAAFVKRWFINNPNCSYGYVEEQD